MRPKERLTSTPSLKYKFLNARHYSKTKKRQILRQIQIQRQRKRHRHLKYIVQCKTLLQRRASHKGRGPMTFSMVWVIASEKKLRYFEEEKNTIKWPLGCCGGLCSEKFNKIYIMEKDHLDLVWKWYLRGEKCQINFGKIPFGWCGGSSWGREGSRDGWRGFSLSQGGSCSRRWGSRKPLN